MNITSGNAPFVRRPRKTAHIMRELLIGLAVIFVAAVVFNFTIGVNYGFKAIGIMVVSILFTFLSDVIAASLRYKKDKDGEYAEYMSFFIKENFSIVTAVIFALTVPIGTPVYVVAVGSIFATLIVKHAFGGFGSNIFNPAAMGRLFLALSFGGQLKAYLPGGENLGGVTAGVTVTGSFAGSGTKFITGMLPSNVSMTDLWLGNYSGALGETFTILILVVGVILAAREVINWRTPLFLFITVALSSVFMALIGGVNVLEYILLQFGLGGLVFGAIFMFTDPVTSPTSNLGKSLIGILGGFLNVLIRVAGSYPEGTAFSIALVNVFSPMIDKLIAGRTDIKLWKPYTATGISLVLSVGLLSGITAAKAPERDSSSTSDTSSEPAGEFDHAKNLLNVAAIDRQDSLLIDGALVTLGVAHKIAYFNENTVVGIIYTAEITGYHTGLQFEVAFKDDVYAGFNVVAHEETAGLGANYLEGVHDRLVGKAVTDSVLVDNDGMTSVTVTRTALKTALEAIALDYQNTEVSGPFMTYHGSYNSPKPHNSQDPFTLNVTVGLDEHFHFVSLTYDTISSPGYLSAAEAQGLVDYYTSIDVATFSSLSVPMLSDDTTGSTVAGQTGDHIVPGKIYSSRALYEAIKAALKDVAVYYGEETSLPRQGAAEEMTLKVNVYVDKTTDKIITLDAYEGTNTTNWQANWDRVYPELLELYQGLEVATFLSYNSDTEMMNEGYGDLVSGVSWSPRRLFAAVQNALEGYGA